jgi:hypothetical protein
VATLVVVVFGYVYTVRPAFQNQLLQEQAAKLQLENDRAQASLRNTQAQQTEAALKLEATSSQLTSVRQALAAEIGSQRQLNARLSAAVRSELSARAEVKKETDELKLNQFALRRSQKRLLMTEMAGLTLADHADDETLMTQHYLVSYSKQFVGDVDGAFIADEAKDWPNPYLHIKRILVTARPSKQDGDSIIPSELVAEYETKLEEMKDRFSCDPVDLPALKRAFLSEIAAVEPAIEKDLEAQVEHMKREEKNPFLYIRVDKAWAESFKSARRTEKTAQIASDYRGKLVGLRRACWDKVSQFSVALLADDLAKH